MDTAPISVNPRHPTILIIGDALQTSRSDVRMNSKVKNNIEIPTSIGNPILSLVTFPYLYPNFKKTNPPTTPRERISKLNKSFLLNKIAMMKLSNKITIHNK